MAMHRLKIGATAGVLAVIGLGCFAGSLAARAADEAARGRILFLRCASCHDVSGSSIGKIGPSLHGVFGRKVASLEGFSYSAALRAQDFVWDAPHLDRWVQNPNAVAPGTIMAFAGIAEEADRQAIIEYLKSQSASGAPAAGAAP
jgi:cytochrome c